MAATNVAPQIAGPAAPVRLGINPEEVFTNSTFSEILNLNMRDSDFITITISDPNYSTSVATIIGIIKDDTLSLSFGSNYTRPFESVLDSTTKSIAGNIGAAVSNVAKVAGTPLYNRNTSLPIWQSPKIPNYTLNFLLVATSDAATQVEKPLLLLSRVTLPKGKKTEDGGTSNFTVITPGPKVNSDTGTLASAITNIASGATSVGNSGAIANAGTISIQYGGLAYFSNCIITDVSYIVKNTRTIKETNQSFDFGNLVNGGGTEGLPYYIFADVSITVMPFYPPEYSASAGNSLGDIQLFYESSGVDKYSTFI